MPENLPSDLKKLRMEKGMVDRGRPYTQVESAKMFDVHLRTWIHWEIDGITKLCIERLWRLRWI